MWFIQLWFAGTAALILGFLIWNYAPILVPLLAVTIGLGVLCAVIVSIAGRFRRLGPSDAEPPKV